MLVFMAKDFSVALNTSLRRASLCGCPRKNFQWHSSPIEFLAVVAGCTDLGEGGGQLTDSEKSSHENLQKKTKKNGGSCKPRRSRKINKQIFRNELVISIHTAFVSIHPSITGFSFEFATYKSPPKICATATGTSTSKIGGPAVSLRIVGLCKPIGSMGLVRIFTYIYHKNQPNVGKYTIHGSYGIVDLVTCIFFGQFLDPPFIILYLYFWAGFVIRKLHLKRGS